MSEIQIGTRPNSFETRSGFPEYMRPHDAARYTGISGSTLAKLRMRANRANGPRFVKLSGCVIYRRSDLDDWIKENVVVAAD